MLVSGKTIVEDKIKLLAEKGVVFNACDFSIKERKVERSKIISVSGFVPAGIVEIVSKQEQGWSYIKAGN
jgi:intracellular sulfur oxidation DsrE/DsrF family protein